MEQYFHLTSTNDIHVVADGSSDLSSTPLSSRVETDVTPLELEENWEASLVSLINSLGLLPVTGHNSKSHIKRPPNAFILYRQYMHHKFYQCLKENFGVNNVHFSRMVASKWRQESPRTRETFTQRALEIKRQHTQLYPDFKYSKRKKSKLYNHDC